MTSDIRRRWPMVFAALLIWGSANLIGSAGQAADGEPAAAGDAEAQAISEQLDAMVGRAAARLGRQGGEEPATRTRTRLPCASASKRRKRRSGCSRTWSSRRCAPNPRPRRGLRREQAAARQSETAPEAAPAPAGSEDPMLAQQVEALTDSVRQLRADVDALRSRAPGEQPPAPGRQSALRPSGSTLESPNRRSGDPLEEDAMLPEAGIGGRYEPWIEEQAAQASGRRPRRGPLGRGHDRRRRGDQGRGGALQLGQRSAHARRRAQDAGRGRADQVDGPGEGAGGRIHRPGRQLGLQSRAVQGARPLGRGRPGDAGLPRDMVEVVGSGEEGLPVPTPDGVPEPLNRSAGIFVVRDATG